MAYIFISYARLDGRELALYLRDDLKRAGYDVWLDTSEISGGASWSREIEEAIERCDIELALLSAGSFRSEICRAEQLRALRKGKRVVPLLSERNSERPLYFEHLNYRDFSDPARFAESFQTLLADITGSETTPLPEHRRYTTVTAPPLPTAFVPRPSEMEELRRAIIGDGGSRQIALTALRGMGGIGKSVLAAALCGDEIVQAAFPDGVIWVTIGREPKSLIPQMREIGKALGDDPARYDTPEASINRLRTLLQNKAVLLVLDDIWNPNDVETFRVDALYCRMLFTTRDAGIALFLGAQAIKLGMLEPEQANALLREWAQRDDPQLAQIAERLGYLPLALKLAGARLREGLSGEEWLQTFQHVSQIKFGRYSTDPKDNLKVCFDLSRNRLPEADHALYHALGIFSQKTPIPDAVIARLWKYIDSQLSDFDCGELLTVMARLELIERHPDKIVTIHDLLHDYMRGNLGDRWKHTHCELLSAYNPTAKPWWEIQHDGYLYGHLAWHLKEAGSLERLRQLLSNFSWLKRMLEATDVNTLIADYDYLADDEEFRSLQSAIRLSAHVLAHDHRQMAAQLIGRLLGNKTPSIQALLNQAVQWRAWPWLRPLTPSLTPPGGSLIRMLAGHMAGVNAVAVTPDGRRAVSGSNDNTLRLWDLENGQTIRILEGHMNWVSAVAVTPDGRRAISGSNDHTLRLWDLESGQTIRTLEGHTNWVLAVAVTPDGRRALSASTDRTLRLWDLESGQTIRILKDHTSSVNAVAVTCDGRRAVSGSTDQTLRLWDLESGQTIRTLKGHTYAVLAVAVTPDGRRALSGSTDRMLRLWDLESGQTIRTLKGHTSSVEALALTPDGHRAISGSEDQTLRLWDLGTGQTCQLQGHTGPVSAVALTPDGRRAVSGGSDRKLRLWDLGTGQTIRPREGHTDLVSAVAVTPDGRGALSGSADQMLRLWDLESGQTIRTLEGHTNWVSAVALTPDGRGALSGSADQTLRLWDLESGQTIRTLEGHAGWVLAVAVTPDGRGALSGSADQTLRLWDLESGQTIRILEGHAGWVRTVAVTPDGRGALSGSADQTLRLWDLKSGQTIRTLEGHTDQVRAVAVTPDGRCAVSGGNDRTLRFWDLESGQTIRTLEGHTDPVRAVAVTPDGRRAVSGGNDQTLRLWDLESGKEIATFTGESDIGSCAVTSDGQTIVVGESSGRVHFLRLVEADPTKLASGETKIPLLAHQQSDKPRESREPSGNKRMFSETIVPQKVGAVRTAALMPPNLAIYLVRHAEKPSSGIGLSPAGEARANAYVNYFQNLTDASGKTIRWDYLFASAESTRSDRPFLTIQPLALAIGKRIDPDYKDKHFSKLVKFIQENPKKQFDNSNILICWHRDEILELARSLGAECKKLPQSSNWPLRWPGKVFGWLLKIYYESDGTLHHNQTQAINEKLMPDDIVDPVYKK